LLVLLGIAKLIVTISKKKKLSLFCYLLEQLFLKLAEIIKMRFLGRHLDSDVIIPQSIMGLFQITKGAFNNLLAF